MIVYKTFSGQINKTQDVLSQQNGVRDELVNFLSEAPNHHYKIIQVSEMAVPLKCLATITSERPRMPTKPATVASSTAVITTKVC